MTTKKGVDIELICDKVVAVKDWTPKQIRDLRKAIGWTQRKLAEWLGVEELHVTHLESGFRAAGKQTERLLAVLEKLHAGQWNPVQPPKRRKAT